MARSEMICPVFVRWKPRISEMPPKQIGISQPYKTAPAASERITSSALRQDVRWAINEPHIDLAIAISRVYGGDDPPEQMLADCQEYRPFINAGMASPRSGLKLSDVENCSTLLDFEKKIEAWYKSRGWTVIPN
jgi:hypothetical protein